MNIDFPKNKPCIDKRGFVIYAFTSKNTDLELTLSEASEFTHAVRELSLSTPLPFLIDLREVNPRFTVEAGQLLTKSDDLKAVQLAQAFLVNSLSKKFLMNFYLQIHMPAYPTKIFDQEEEAIQWLIGINHLIP